MIGGRSSSTAVSRRTGGADADEGDVDGAVPGHQSPGWKALPRR